VCLSLVILEALLSTFTHLISVSDEFNAHCMQMSVKNCFIRGSVVRYIQVGLLRLD